MIETSGVVRPFYYPKLEWRAAALLAAFYFVVYAAAKYFLPEEISFDPASPLLLCLLYFGGLHLWPLAAIVALGAATIAGEPLPLLALLPLMTVCQAIAGAYLLQATRIDPLFRRYRDTFYLIATVGIVSFITPLFSATASIAAGISYPVTLGWQEYIATACCFLIIVPFILRWVTKPRLRRTWAEILETSTVFALLLALDYIYFTKDIQTVGDVPVHYLLLIPLFWIALRLRPRFVTAAMLVTSLIAIASVLTNTEAVLLAARLFEMELYLIVIAIMFFIIVSLEEDRRVNLNLMHSQLGTLENAITRLSSESRMKNDFIAILAHELRNPLAPVVSAIDLLKLKGPKDPEDRDTLHMMSERMETVRRLLDDLLDISRISEGKVAIKRERVEIESIVERAILSTEHHRKELHQSLVFKGAGMPLSVVGDPVRFEQIFSNLLTNASKYSNTADIIKLSLRENNGQAEIEVVDEGVGLEKNVLESIFIPFRQVEQGERSGKGLGIGLALVRSFVEVHGGTITARSGGKGKGSTFVVRLPLAPPIQEEAKKEVKERPTFKEGGEPLVLIVDDNDAAAAGIGRLLERSGCRVAYAYDGRNALEQASRLSPSVMLLDIGLPDQDGYAVAHRLRQRGFKGQLIALTGFSDDEARRRMDEAGFEAHIVKPASLADLRRVLPDLI